MFIMKNVRIIVKLRRLLKSLTVCFFIPVIFVAGTAFKPSFENGDPKKSVAKDILHNDKSGFKSLFSASYFDPTKPYVTQLNPKALPFVQNYIREEGASLEKMKVWGKPYFDVYDGILRQYGLPVELKYLSVIESSLISNSVSKAGAVGPWQIMDYEAKRMGLRVGGANDERKNFYKSTYAAARILKELHGQFKDWLLVVAAYNCGAGGVRKAIRKSGSKNFWDLQDYLPAETRGHVKRFIGTHFIFEGNGGLTTMTASEVLDFDLNLAAANNKNLSGIEDPANAMVEVSGRYKSTVIAKNLGMELKVFNQLNPNFDKLIAMGQSYKMRLPTEKAALFATNKNTILDESVQFLLSI
ncbi:MAG: Membrane-bound lytic murein transglycosylase [Segetibacter sp.]|jgi:membrane-bound lytic murein transglycosylase D|nr:Membrane-bound lytic murein transglycosylase [Segetibacter sp.]